MSDNMKTLYLMRSVDVKHFLFLLLLAFCSVPGQLLSAESPHQQSQDKITSDGIVMKKILNLDDAGDNLLKPQSWQPWQKGYEQQGNVFCCDNGTDTQVQRGISQTIILNQSKPEPIVAVAWSKSEGVGGSRDNDYSLYLDLIYSDGTPLWGRTDQFNVGSHDWEKAQVFVFPEKPVKSVSFYMLLRSHSGKAWFRDPSLRVIKPPTGACLFDGVAISRVHTAKEGFQIRDVAAETDFVSLEHRALGLELKYQKQQQSGGVTFFDVSLTDTTGKDRAINLIYSIPIPSKKLQWFHDPRQNMSVEQEREYLNTSSFSAGANGRFSRYPFAAVADKEQGFGIGIDLAYPAFFRVGYNSGTEELFLAYDIGLAPEKPNAKLRFCKFNFDPRWQFRAALDRFYEIFPDYFRCRIPQQGLWMPFAKISEVKNWQDFGFKFKEGTNETKWDDEHEIITFRYTEPMTWWMSMPKEMPRTLKAALSEAQRLDRQKGDPRAKALFSSGFHNEAGQFTANLLDTPWCNGAVWSINSMPDVKGEITDFKNKWNPALRKKLYGPQRKVDLDGEYIDSSEGYVTDELNFRREHFAIAGAPLTFSLDSRKVAIFRGLIAFDYVRAISRDIHAMDKLMMANSTPIRLCWLAPLLDVMGSETNWNPGGKWQPMSDSDLLYRRAMCRSKPYCFLMNTHFEQFSHELVEKYMKRTIAYGMFPGFFSHNASERHYFSRPELYERDRGLFKRFVPLCKLVAEAGWEPITLAHSDDQRVYVERFGSRYLTIFNDSEERRTVAITLEQNAPATSRELVHGQTIEWDNRKTTLILDGWSVEVIEIE